VAAVMLLTLRGTPTLYYGDELGMRDAVIFPEQMQDPQGKQIGVSRDPARTPMQWNAGLHAGFTSGIPWLPVGYDYQICNVEAESEDRNSMLSLYRRLIALRRAEPALSVGAYKPVVAQGQLVAFLREAGEQRYLVVLNLGSRPDHLSLADVGEGQVVIATDVRREGERVSGRIVMLGDDAAVIRLRPTENVR
jgi:alpha-glucosidase